MSTPSLREIIDRINSDVISEIPEANPALANSCFSAIITALGGRVNEVYAQNSLLASRILLNTATGDFTDVWASIFNKIRLLAPNAVGSVCFTGTVGTIIPVNTIVLSPTSIQYTTNAPITITLNNYVAAPLSITGIVVTATISGGHNLGTGATVTISATTPSSLSGSFTITVISNTQFTYNILTPIGDGVVAGGGTVTITSASVSVTAVVAGSSGNQQSGTRFALLNAIAGVDSGIYPTFGGITSGADVESDISFRNRVLYRTRNPVADRSVSYYEDLLYSINGITRAWVRPLYNVLVSANGYVTIYYVRDNESPIIPSGGDLIATRAAIPTPADRPENHIIVAAPTLQPIDFSITVSPDTPDMRDAVSAAYQQFFRESLTLGFKLPTPNVISYNQYSRPVQIAVDLKTGVGVENFNISSPSGNIAVADDHLPVFGTITWI